MRILAVRNGLWNALANATTSLVGALGSIIVVRSLSPDEYGLFSYYLWLASILGTLGTLALAEAVTKVTSELRGQGIGREALALARWATLGLLVINCAFAMAVLVWALQSPSVQRTYLLIIAVIVVPNGLMAVFRSTLWGSERYRPVSVSIIAASLIQLALIGIAYLANWGGPGYAAAVLSASVTQAIGFGLALVWKRDSLATPLGLRLPSRGSLRLYFGFAGPATLVLLFDLVIWQRSGVFFLERYSTLEQVGYFSLAFTIFYMFLTLGWALVNGFYPAISHDYGAGNWLRISERMRQGVLMAALFSVPLTFGGWATLEGLITLLYGQKMLPAVSVTQILFLGLIPGTIAAMFGLMVNAVGGVWLHVKLGVIISVFNITLNLILTPAYGAVGSAVATTGTQVVHVALLVAATHRLYGLRLPWRALVSLLAIGVATTFLLPELLRAYLPGTWGLFAAIGLSGCLYLMLVWRLGHLQPLRKMEVAP
ncbi:MAG: oligosaccharide flippase family protein [Chloroflexota bacterium]